MSGNGHTTINLCLLIYC